MEQSERPVSAIISEIKSYNGKQKTTERMEDLEILTEELGPGYTVKQWTFNNQLRVAVIKGEYQL